ncbi:MAG: undecaprenyldiphospho-muramoylpentapeptide beta-N-acetylglucosaminyltransferase [Gammaproteobacteria bacterium]|nr:undecaprenyldiphospho-muramoylpentapeptide beta-N-acetylglucosaminyltransferase [Gammaproteobacteria bacterium]
MRRPVLIMAGGTGGHVFPALAVAQELSARDVPVVWLGTRRGLEAEVVPASGVPIEWLSIVGLRGKGWSTTMLFPLRLARAVLQAWRIFVRLDPCVALGMGGFVSGPGGLAAWLRRVPLVIHEQNAIPGLTNRVLACVATRTLEAVPNTFRRAVRTAVTGNPVRGEIARIVSPEQRLAQHGPELRVLIFGGSSGAAALNDVLPAACAELPDARVVRIWHQVGRLAPLDEIRSRYRDAAVDARVERFITDMSAAYAWADLVICRSGAITVAELAIAGVASVLVPYPHAVDDHQTQNARCLTKAGAAELLPQAQLSAGHLAVRLHHYHVNRAQLLGMACAARQLARPDAARDVAENCLAVAA